MGAICISLLTIISYKVISAYHSLYTGGAGVSWKYSEHARCIRCLATTPMTMMMVTVVSRFNAQLTPGLRKWLSGSSFVV